MSIRSLVIVLAAVAAPAAFASSGATWVGGEIGFTDHAITGQRTRAQVQQEFEAFRNHPVSSDGAVFIQGELGYVSANQGAGFDRVPAHPHTHWMGNVGAPTSLSVPPLSEAERRAYREQYTN